MSTGNNIDNMLQSRIYPLKQSAAQTGAVVYLCSRDQRLRDNAALYYAQQVALQLDSPLVVMFRLIKAVPNRAKQHYMFMLDGLKEFEQLLNSKQISFELVAGDSIDVVKRLNLLKAAHLVCDFSPLRGPRKFQKELANEIDIPVSIVDAHNSVPVWVASQKQEYAARTIRPKIHKHLPDYLADTWTIKKHPHKTKLVKTDWQKAERYIQAKEAADLKISFRPGEKAAHKALDTFISDRLESYSELRNDPANNHLSDLSPYLHFGMLSAADAARAAMQSNAPQQDIDAFVEELIIRKELSDNYCFYNPDYDSLDGAPEWAINTLNEHASDPREYLYSYSDFVKAKTHDPAWNAAQVQMKTTGKMHGYMRMYWAKKILEWTTDAKTALEITIKLNDSFSIDGYDPNGYTGIMWSICGVHDRGWTEREILGKIRYMNFNGLKRKFDIQRYIEQWQQKTS